MTDRDPDFYKLHYRQWMQAMHRKGVPYDLQGALLCIVNYIHAIGAPRNDEKVLAGILACSPRKARAVVDQLLDLRLVSVEDGLIVSEQALEDAERRRDLREQKARAGHEGGVRSGVVRRDKAEMTRGKFNSASTNTLKNNGTHEAHSQSRFELEERRVDRETSLDPTLSPRDSIVSLGGEHTPAKRAAAAPLASDREARAEFDTVWKHYPRKVAKAEAEREWIKARRDHSFDAVARPLGVFIRAVRDTDPSKIPHLRTWLHQKRFLDDDQSHAANVPTGPPGPVYGERFVNAAEAAGITPKADLFAGWDQPKQIEG